MAEFRNVATNAEMLAIAEAIREIAEVPDEMTILDMPGYIRMALIAPIIGGTFLDEPEGRPLVGGDF